MPTPQQIAKDFRDFQLQQEKRFAPRLYAILRRQTNEVLKSVQQQGIDTTLTMLSAIVLTDPIATELAYLWRSVGYKSADMQIVIIRAFPEISKQWGIYEWTYVPGWETKVKEAKAFGLSKLFADLMDRFFSIFGGNKIVNITDTTREWVRRKLNQAQEEGWDYYTLARNMRTDSIPFNRARVIARTETVGATNAGQMVAARQSGLVMQKRWVNMRDKRVREQHQNAPRGVGGETRPLEEPYSNGLMQPGDPTGSARQVIQCRCVQTFEPMRDASGRLLRR